MGGWQKEKDTRLTDAGSQFCFRFFYFFFVLKCQTTDVVDVCLCWYLWRFLAACLYTWQSVCSLQADIWNHLAICRLNYVNTLPLCQHFAIKSTLCNYVNTLRRHQFSDSSNVLVSFSRSISWTGNFAHTVHLFFPVFSVWSRASVELSACWTAIDQWMSRRLVNKIVDAS